MVISGIDKCTHDDCNLRDEFGYCKVTACANPLHNHENVCRCALKPEPAAIMPPTRSCAVCGKREYENAVVGKLDFWLCEECLGRLKETLYPAEHFGICAQEEIQHVGYDDMQLGREK